MQDLSEEYQKELKPTHMISHDRKIPIQKEVFASLSQRYLLDNLKLNHLSYLIFG